MLIPSARLLHSMASRTSMMSFTCAASLELRRFWGCVKLCAGIALALVSGTYLWVIKRWLRRDGLCSTPHDFCLLELRYFAFFRFPFELERLSLLLTEDND